jgi:tetratricopeptide (TPR) repeat protein
LRTQRTSAQKISFTLAAGILCSSTLAMGQGLQLPIAAANATVKTDSLRVFAKMDPSSSVVRSLAKGETVYVDLRVDQGAMLWCGVRITGQAGRLGFVDCRSLERVAAPQPANTGRTGIKASGKAQVTPGEMPFSRPAMPTQTGYAAIKAAVVKDGEIDSGYIAQAEAQAKAGAPTALRRAAWAHFAAGEFDLSQNELDGAIQHFEAMEAFAGQQHELLRLSLLGRARALLLESEFSSALEAIERVRKIAPRSAEAAAMAGWAHYRLNQTDAAIADFETAQRLGPNEGVARLLNKVKQDRNAESDFREGESSHFVLRYHGGASHQLAREIIQSLEEQFRSLSSELRYTPPEPIAVILYTREAFRDVTRAPGWSSAVNDGRIRVPVQGVETVSPELQRILKHELTHSFVFQKTAGRCPTWLHEGVAQFMEGRRTGADAGPLVAFFEHGQGKGLRYYPGSWMNMTAPQARFAYAWSLAVVEAIEAQSGLAAVDRLLDAERTEASGEAALRLALHTNFSGLDDTTIIYLRQTYPH